MKNDRIRFQHMIDACEEIMEYTATHHYDDLRTNRMLLQSANAMLAQANQLPQNVLQLLR